MADKQRTIAPGARWEFLDSMRAIAAVVVLMEHWLQVYMPATTIWLWRYFYLGGMGVAMFFLVSGFIIPVSLEKYSSLTAFWIGRLFRLFPLYLLSMGLAVLFRHAGLFPDLEVHATRWRTILGNAFMAQELFRVPYPIPVYWSLSFEAVFYLICSTLYLFGTLYKSRLWSLVSSLSFLALSILAGLVFHRGLSAEKAGVILTAMFGTVVYRYSMGKESRRGVVIAGVSLGVSLIVGFWFRLFSSPDALEGRIPTFASLTTAWAVAGLVFFLLFAMKNREFPRVLLWLGRISYSIYLMHPFVLALVKDRVSAPLSIPLVLIGTLVLAQTTYVTVEAPFSSLHKRLFPRKARLTSPPSTTVSQGALQQS